MVVADKPKKRTINHGKRFEEDFRTSVPADVYYQRLKDDAMGFKGIQNECDYIVYNEGTLYLLELKSTKNKTSIPVSNITDYQLESLITRGQMDGIVAGFLINFREVKGNPTYYIDAIELQNYLQKTQRKSIPLAYFEENCVQCISNKKRVRYTYDVANLLTKIKH